MLPDHWPALQGAQGVDVKRVVLHHPKGQPFVHAGPIPNYGGMPHGMEPRWAPPLGQAHVQEQGLGTSTLPQAQHSDVRGVHSIPFAAQAAVPGIPGGPSAPLPQVVTADRTSQAPGRLGPVGQSDTAVAAPLVRIRARDGHGRGQGGVRCRIGGRAPDGGAKRLRRPRQTRLVRALGV